MDLTWDYPHLGFARARFSPEEDELLLGVSVNFEQREPDGPWYASFEVEGIDLQSGVRSAFDIFNGVVQAIEEFLSVRQPQSLVIAAKEDRLGRIYETYLRREPKSIADLGYQLVSAEKVHPFSEFRLERAKPSDRKQ
jgi:hypothetical protein